MFFHGISYSKGGNFLSFVFRPHITHIEAVLMRTHHPHRGSIWEPFPHLNVVLFEKPITHMEAVFSGYPIFKMEAVLPQSSLFTCRLVQILGDPVTHMEAVFSVEFKWIAKFVMLFTRNYNQSGIKFIPKWNWKFDLSHCIGIQTQLALHHQLVYNDIDRIMCHNCTTSYKINGPGIIKPSTHTDTYYGPVAVGYVYQALINHFGSL